MQTAQKNALSKGPVFPDARFTLGQICRTPGAGEALAASGQAPWDFLQRHQSGDWGTIGAADKRLNDKAVKSGERILSAYQTSQGTRIWIITEADRSVTTILLPEEY